MKKLLFLTNFFLCFTLHAESWLHFNQQADYFVAYYQVKRLGLTPKNQLAHPLRISVAENISPEKANEYTQKLPGIVAINNSSEAVIPFTYYSPWGVGQHEKDQYTKYVWAGATTITLIHGVSAWRWFNESIRFSFGEEKWFSRHSYSGGADKTGHMFSMYFQKRGLNWFFLKIGHDLDSANLQSALLTEVLGIIVEVGDGMTHYHFSYEDVVMNTVGIIAAYYADKYPWLDELVGLKWQYWPSHDLIHGDDLGKSNITSDYSGQTFWLTLKASGIPQLNQTNWRYLSLDFGYYTRGFIPDIENSKWPSRYRALSMGVSLNLSELFFKATPSNNATITTTRLLKYWTPPYTVLPLATRKLE